MAHVLGCRDPHALAFATDLGIAMQLTNIARDVHEDAQRGRLYLPQQWLGEKPVSAEQLVQGRSRSPSSSRKKPWNACLILQSCIIAVATKACATCPCGSVWEFSQRVHSIVLLGMKFTPSQDYLGEASSCFYVSQVQVNHHKSV